MTNDCDAVFFKFQKMFANVTVRLSIGSSSVVTGENKIVDKLKKIQLKQKCNIIGTKIYSILNKRKNDLWLNIINSI